MTITRWEPSVERAITSLQRKGLKSYASNEQPERGKCICIYGKSGIGKTSEVIKIANTPELSPVGYANAEGGAWVLKHRDDIIITDIDKWADYESYCATICGMSESPFKTVVIDLLAPELQAKSIIAQVGNSKVERQHWGKSHGDILNTTRMWRTWSQRTGNNVIFLCGQNSKQVVNDGPTYEEIAMTRGLREAWPHLMDIIGQITYAGSTKRMIDFYASDLRNTKFRRDRGDAAMKIPLRFTYTEPDAPLADILLVLNEGRAWPAKYKQAAPPAEPAQPTATTASTSSASAAMQGSVEARVEEMQAQTTEN